MTTLENRDRTALLVIDMQVDVLAGTHRREEVLANVGALVERARAEQVPVIWVQHASEELPESSAGWRIVPELRPGASEPLVPKRYGDAFEDTVLVGDAHTTQDFSAHGLPPADGLVARSSGQSRGARAALAPLARIAPGGGEGDARDGRRSVKGARGKSPSRVGYVAGVLREAGQATGTISIPLDLTQLPPPLGSVQAGETWDYTTWFRDVNPTTTSNFTDAVAVTYQ